MEIAAMTRRLISDILKSKKWTERLEAAQNWNQVLDVLNSFIDSQIRRIKLMYLGMNIVPIVLIFTTWWLMNPPASIIFTAASIGASIVAWDIQFSECWQK